MNLPNILTIGRILITPLFIILLFYGYILIVIFLLIELEYSFTFAYLIEINLLHI